MIEAGTQSAPAPPRQLTGEEVEHAVTVLCDAFYNYPVMRYVLGSTSEYDRRLRRLIEFFVSARVLRKEPVLGIYDVDGVLAAAALVTLPGERPSPEALDLRRESLWAELGGDERARYEAFGNAWAKFALETPQHHLNMIGVRRSHLGRGLARRLLEAVHLMAEGDPGSAGVSLTTETPQNLSFYQYFGYELLGNVRVDSEFETWGFFRPALR